MSYVRSVLITDFDNTVWDWFGAWHKSFTAMLEKLVEISGLSKYYLLAEIRKVHQRYGTSEYAFLLKHLECLREAAGSQDLLELYRPAIEAYRDQRRAACSLYPGVTDCFRQVRAQGTQIVMLTDSLSYYVAYQLQWLGLDGLVDLFASPGDHEIPRDAHSNEWNLHPPMTAKLKHTRHFQLPPGVQKPDSDVLTSILEHIRADASDCCFVGDSKLKDMVMAKNAGVLDVHAAYGSSQDQAEYILLRCVSHWPDDMIATEKKILQNSTLVQPTIILRESISDILTQIDFVRSFQSTNISVSW